MPLNGPLDFEVVAWGVGADEQQNDVGGVELLVNDLERFVTGENLVLASTGNDALAFEEGEVIGQLGLQCFVVGGVGELYGNGLAL